MKYVLVYWRPVASVLAVVLVILALIWLINTIHMNAGSWLALVGMILGCTLVAVETNWLGE